jgi:hypothetical protein
VFARSPVLLKVTLSFSNRYQFLLTCHGACVDQWAQPPMYALVTELCERTLKQAIMDSGVHQIKSVCPQLNSVFCRCCCSYGHTRHLALPGSVTACSVPPSIFLFVVFTIVNICTIAEFLNSFNINSHIICTLIVPFLFVLSLCGGFS